MSEISLYQVYYNDLRTETFVEKRGTAKFFNIF
jgi:hypothetical protein